jgi:hypothetical protein
MPRPYHPDLTPAPSDLRPHCAAGDRLLLWLPYGKPPLVEPLTDVDQWRIQVIKFRGLARTTREMYGSGLLLYHVFCDSRGVSEALRAPASTNLVEVFLASITGAYSASAISNYYAAVRAWHLIHNVPWGFAEGDLSQLIKGAADIAKHIPSLRRVERQPFTVAELNAVCSQLISDNSLDAAVWACITIAFWGIARMQELTVPTLGSSSFDSTRHPQITDVSKRIDPRLQRLVTVIHIPSTKSAPLAGEDILFAAQQGSCDPDAALLNHCRVNCPQPGEHLFAYNARGKRRPLSQKVLLLRLQSACSSAGISDKHGHSFRIGGTLEYLLRGLSFELVKYLGRWKSDAFQVYLRRRAEVLAPYVQAQPSIQVEIARLSVPQLPSIR